MEGTSSKKESKVKVYLHRYFIDAMSAMAQGLFASLLIGTIISTLGTQLNIPLLDEIGGYAKSAAGPAMAVAIGYALQAPPLVLFSLVAVGGAATRSAAQAVLSRCSCSPSSRQSSVSSSAKRRR